MKFSAFSLFTLSSLFIGALAAPTAGASQRDVVPARVEKRAVEETCSNVIVIMKQLVTEVKTHTGAINATMSSLPVAPAVMSEAEKLAIFTSVQSSCQQIVSAISTAIVSITKLEVVEAVDADLDSIVAIIVELITEIVLTLKGVVFALESTIAEVLGIVLPLLVNVIIALLQVVGVVVGDVVTLVKAVLSPVLETVGEILIGLGEFLTSL